MTANQFEGLKSGDSFLGQGSLLVSIPSALESMYCKLLGPPRHLLAEPGPGKCEATSTEFLQSQPPSLSDGRGSCQFRALHGPLAGLTPQKLYPHLKSGELRTPDPDSSSSSSCFPASLPPFLWPSQSQLPKITQCLGVLCPRRWSCLVWAQGGSPEEGGLWGAVFMAEDWEWLAD